MPLVVGDDLAACADPVRGYAALYIGGMGSREQNFYNDLAVRMGYADAAAEVQDRYLARDYDGAAAAVPVRVHRRDLAARAGRSHRRADGRVRRGRGHDAERDAATARRRTSGSARSRRSPRAARAGA